MLFFMSYHAVTHGTNLRRFPLYETPFAPQVKLRLQSYEEAIHKPCASPEHVMHKHWTSYEQIMNMSQQAMNKSLTVSEKVLNK